MKRFLLIGACLGLLVPALLWSAYFFGGYQFDTVAWFLWPSAIMLMALEGNASSIVAIEVWAASLLANVLLYSLVSIIVFWLWKAFHRTQQVNQQPR
jgi:hypothetical protein